jgi:hypothetical protein
MTWTHTSMIADVFPFLPLAIPASICSISSAPGCFVPQRSGCAAYSGATVNKTQTAAHTRSFMFSPPIGLWLQLCRFSATGA